VKILVDLWFLYNAGNFVTSRRPAGFEEGLIFMELGHSVPDWCQK
jgi:hypothetical protein